MKIIIYITALICSLLASPALATETGQISMTNMGLKVTSTPESTLYEGDTWMITARNNFSLNEAEIKNFVPSRISEELRPYVRLSKVEFTSNSDGICNLYFHITADPTDTIRFVIKESPQDFPIEITPAESRHGEISLSDLGLRIRRSVDSNDGKQKSLIHCRNRKARAFKNNGRFKKMFKAHRGRNFRHIIRVRRTLF